MSDTPALLATGVSKRYSRGAPPALDGIDVAIRTGSITALVGPNGAGKSTLIKAWAGFERPSTGSVAVCGIDPFKSRVAATSQIGYVPQSASLYRDLTVEEHLSLASTLRRGFDADLARSRLKDLGIPLTSLAGRLSGGQQAQISLAVAIGTRAPVLLLDEPLAALDPLARREFLFVLTSTVAETGGTALFSSHVATDVEQACDHLVILGGGRKLLDAPKAQALLSHSVVDGDAPAAGRAVASYLDPRGGVLTLVDLGSGEPTVGTRAATVEDLMLGYLAAGRPGMLNRICSTRKAS